MADMDNFRRACELGWKCESEFSDEELCRMWSDELKRRGHSEEDAKRVARARVYEKDQTNG